MEASFISSVLDDIESSPVPDAELEEDIKVIGLVTFSGGVLSDVLLALPLIIVHFQLRMKQSVLCGIPL